MRQLESIYLHIAKEWDGACRAELQAHPHPPGCLFSDISNFLQPQLQHTLNEMKTAHSLESDLKDYALRDKAFKPTCKAFCVIHKKNCCVADDCAQVHVAGTPCTAHSVMGLSEENNLIPYGYFLTWCAIRRQVQEWIIIQECTEFFLVMRSRKFCVCTTGVSSS